MWFNILHYYFWKLTGFPNMFYDIFQELEVEIQTIIIYFELK